MHLVRKGLKNTETFLEVKKALEWGDVVVVIDSFPKRDYGNCEIFSSLVEGKEYFYYPLRSNFLPGNDERIVRDPKILQNKLENFKNVLVVAPYTLPHFLFIQAVIKKEKHPAFDSVGNLKQDARWVFKKLHTNYDEMLRNAIGYAMPYPDVLGIGRDFLYQIEVVESGTKHPLFFPFSKERVENSQRLVDTNYRCYKKSYSGVIEVNANGAGWFHTGTLMVLIKEKWPEAKWGTIFNDRSPISKKTNQPQISIACLNPEMDFRKHFEKIEGNKVVTSPVFVHMEREEFDKFKFPEIK